jgi:carbonic anhydrase
VTKPATSHLSVGSVPEKPESNTKINKEAVMVWALGIVVLLFCSGPLFAQNAGPTPDEALKMLKEGNARFVKDMPKEAELGSKRRIELAEGQRPFAVILTCSDSRAAPEIIFDKRLGMLFVIRVAGNVTGPEVYGSIEYALAVLKTPLVVVLGHAKCGAVEAALKNEDQPSDNLKQLVSLIHTGKKLPKDKSAALKSAIRNNVLYQTELLTKKSDIIRDFTTSGRVRIVPAVYDLSSGEVNWLEAKKK